jgi:hypothetical protein
MNQDNYCSLEISRKLVEAGIMLKTDHYWTRKSVATGRLVKNMFSNSGYVEGHERRWVISYKPNGVVGENIWPAPSFAELWRELPEANAYLHNNGITEVWLEGEDGNSVSESYADTNPADALAKLLVWVRKEIAHDRP